MPRTVFFIVSSLIAPLAVAAESPIAALDRSVTPIVRKYYPDAQIAVTTTSYVAKSGTMEFTVHGHLMTGEIAQQPHHEEGPNYKGFLLRVDIQDGPNRNQPVTPQTLREVYWNTFLDAPRVAAADQTLWIRFSYGSRTSDDFKRAILAAMPKSRPGA